jgi:hypothetical protein
LDDLLAEANVAWLSREGSDGRLDELAAAPRNIDLVSASRA